ncbi:MAG: RNA 2',3'-cyclic phosphodiesterase [Actinomycetota bacterium]|nr:RNA 2',3'-cyclic phosphodiesterase [Actinomycetota bacterium]
MAGDKLRLFTAVRVPRAQLEWLDEATADLRSVPGARWTGTDNQHVTLNFLGWVHEDAFDDVTAAVDAVASHHAPARLSIGDLGAFPRERRARVLWAGIDDSGDLLPALASELGHELRSIGYVPEDRPYTAHLTLARFKTPRSLEGVLRPLPAPPEPFDVDRVTLFRSRLSPAGARYEVVHEAYLTGRSP